MRILVLALSLLVASGLRGAGATPPSLPLHLGAVSGLPSDSAARAAFMDGLRGQLRSEHFATESVDAQGEWHAGEPADNRFRLTEDAGGDDAWQLSISVGSPAPVVSEPAGGGHKRSSVTRRRSRGMIAGFTMQPPPDGAGERASTTVQAAFAFPVTGLPEGVSLGIPENGYVFSWSQAGNVVGRLALETLHRASHDLDEARRADIAPALRTESGR